MYNYLLDRLCGLVVQRSGFDSRRYQIFWEVVGLEPGPLSLVSTIEELLGRKSSGSSLETRDYGRGDPVRWPCVNLYTKKLALTSPTSGGRSVGIVRSRTQAAEFMIVCDVGKACLCLFHVWYCIVACFSDSGRALMDSIQRTSPRYNTLLRPQSRRSHITTDSQSASPFWCQAPIWDPRPIFLSPWNFL
jgi:hypothetical protein